MKIVIFSDIHGNLPALNVMLKDAGHADQYICLGDIVDYGPWSNECVEIVNSLDNCVVLKGNHEEYFLKRKFTGGNETAKLFFETCIRDFTKQKLISNLAETYTLHSYCFTHTLHNQRIYIDSKIQLDANYVIGHSHHQFKLTQGKFTLYNAGSVGQNRAYINVINYLVYNTKENSFQMKSITYDVDLIIDEMKRRGYPFKCIEYYSNKKRQ